MNLIYSTERPTPLFRCGPGRSQPGQVADGFKFRIFDSKSSTDALQQSIDASNSQAPTLALGKGNRSVNATSSGTLAAGRDLALAPTINAKGSVSYTTTDQGAVDASLAALSQALSVSQNALATNVAAQASKDGAAVVPVTIPGTVPTNTQQAGAAISGILQNISWQVVAAICAAILAAVLALRWLFKPKKAKA